MPKIRVILLANWGIGEAILKALHYNERADLRGVVTQYDEDSKDPWMNVVYNRARTFGHTPLKQKVESFDSLRALCLVEEADYLIVHAYPYLLPASVYDAPKFGSINFHPSLLPKYRGRRPTIEVLKNRESETGLTCHFIDKDFDTGEIIDQERIPVDADDDRESIIEKMKEQVGYLVDRIILNPPVLKTL
jgi:methionyl-tRNA formyltransferase